MEQILPNRIAGTLRMVAWIVRKGVNFLVVSSARITFLFFSYYLRNVVRKVAVSSVYVFYIWIL